jgi:hypothetical protein
MNEFYSSIREEELKNRVAADFFGAYDCTRIVGNIDFCVSAKVRDSHQMSFMPEETFFWAEAKNHPTDIYQMLAQLILTIHNESSRLDLQPPRFIGCFDNEKIAFVEYHNILPVFSLNDFNWTQTPSSVDNKTIETLRGILTLEKVRVFRFGDDEAEIKNFIRKNLVLGLSADFSMQVDKNNFIFVYQKWRNSVLPYIDAPWEILKKKYSLYDRDFFLAELNTDDCGTVAVDDDRSAEDFYIEFNASSRLPYSIRRKNEDELDISLSFGFKPDGMEAYAAFWRRYKRPPKKEYWDYIVSRLDLLVPQDVRERKGSFFTPAIWVEKSQQYLAAELGENWQDEYYVWDCCAGTGNLLAGLTNKYRVWASTLDQQDVDVMRERIKNGANLLDSHIFQFDFLNDSFDKLPQGLREIVDDSEKRKKLVIYINPPYAEVSSKVAVGGNLKGKRGVNVTEIQKKYSELLGTASRELFAQFLIRIAQEMSGCIIGQFSKTKHLQGSAFAQFRNHFIGDLKRSFLVPADTFDNVKGKFPIGFFVWRLGGNNAFTSTIVDVYERNGEFKGLKSLAAYSKNQYINAWISQYRQKENNAIGYMDGVNGNDFQHNSIVYIINKKSLLPNPRGIWINNRNLIEICIYLAVRHCVTSDWLNDRDNFLVPTLKYKEDNIFRANCLVYTLFSDFCAIKNRHGINHWIPFTEEEVRARDCFQSHFMSDWLSGKRCADSLGQDELNLEGGVSNSASSESLSLCVKENLSFEARAVMDAGRELWRYYHSQPNSNPDASYYDIRLHFQGVKKMASGKEQMNPSSSDSVYTELLSNLRKAHRALAQVIESKVYEYGFLKR